MFLNFYFQILNFDFINKFNYFSFKKAIKIEKITVKIYFNVLTFKNLLYKSFFLQFFLLKKKRFLIKISKQDFLVKTYIILRHLKKIASSII